ncbi:MAG: hypothetical protein ACI31S_01535 [Bacilli bacterium]
MDNELKKKILFAGYYEDNKDYIVEISKQKLIDVLKKEFKADEIKFI